MRLHEKATSCWDIQATQRKISRTMSIPNLALLKDRCFRWAAWLSQIGGGL
jgi:hypothetical protein